MKLSAPAIAAIWKLVEELASESYSTIEGDGRIGRLSEQELRRAITDYGRTLVPLPADAIAQIEVFRSDPTSRTFAVDVPLWTAEDGRSDLTLSLTLLETDHGPELRIDDLHVL